MSSLYLGPWRVDVEWRDDVPRLLPSTVLARTVAAALDAAGAPGPASIGLILADDAELADLNATHMGKDGPTDVLSFPLLPPSAYPPHLGQPPGVRSTNGGVAFALPPDARPHLGDVIASVERAVEQAEAGRGGQTGDVRWDARDELRLLVTHGTLHVCGWDPPSRPRSPRCAPWSSGCWLTSRRRPQRRRAPDGIRRATPLSPLGVDRTGSTRLAAPADAPSTDACVAQRAASGDRRRRAGRRDRGRRTRYHGGEPRRTSSRGRSPCPGGDPGRPKRARSNVNSAA